MNEVKEKKHYRAWAKEIRANLGQSGLRKISMDIEQKIRELSEFKKANLIMTYLAKEEIEVSLSGLFNVVNKKWFLPKIDCSRETPSLLVSPYEPGATELKKGSFDILEPELVGDDSYDQKEKKVNLDLIFVPGLCFDRAGNRIGFGKGFYDQFLKLNPNSFKVGCCPKECYVKALPVDIWDEKVDLVITGQ